MNRSSGKRISGSFGLVPYLPISLLCIAGGANAELSDGLNSAGHLRGAVGGAVPIMEAAGPAHAGPDAVALWLLLAQAEAPAAPGSPEARYQAAFDAMLADLANPERSFEFVEAATAVGDVRGATAALERILLLNPRLANIKLELGVLYRRLGNDQLAVEYLQQALATGDVPEGVRGRAEALLAQAQAALRRHLFDGSVFAAVRYETNANTAPDTPFVFDPLPGLPDRLLDDDTEQEDFSFLAVGELEYAYVLDGQAGNRIEADLLLLGERYFDATEEDTELVDVTLGPRFFLGPVDEPDLSLRPFATVIHLRRDADRFLSGYGGGLEARKAFTRRLVGTATAGAEYQDFDEDERSGLLLFARGGLSYDLTRNTTVGGRLRFATIEAEEEFESFDQIGAVLALTQRYDAPLGLTEDRWSTSLELDLRYTDYEGLEPDVDPEDEREDTFVEVTLATNVPLDERLTAVGTVSYANNESTVDIDDYDNLAFTLGLAWDL